MWISKYRYDRLMERLGDAERAADKAKGDSFFAVETSKDTRKELIYLRDQFRVLLDSLGLEHHRTPAKEAYVKKGGPERPSCS